MFRKVSVLLWSCLIVPPAMSAEEQHWKSLTGVKPGKDGKPAICFVCQGKTDAPPPGSGDLRVYHAKYPAGNFSPAFAIMWLSKSDSIPSISEDKEGKIAAIHDITVRLPTVSKAVYSLQPNHSIERLQLKESEIEAILRELKSEAEGRVHDHYFSKHKVTAVEQLASRLKLVPLEQPCHKPPGL